MATNDAAPAGRPLPCHAIAEAECYGLLQNCPGCGAARLEPGPSTTVNQHITRTIDLPLSCADCGHMSTLRFDVAADDGPSTLLDIAQWLTLAHRLLAAPPPGEAPAIARTRKLRAATCLDEALRFYEADNDLPPDAAFFDPARLRRARANPRPYLRSVVLDQRRKLPSPHRPAS